MLKTHQHAITASMMFLERPRPHLLLRSRPPRVNLAKTDNTRVCIYTHTHIYIYINIAWSIYQEES